MNNFKYSNGSATYVESLEKKIAGLEKQIVAIDMNNEPVAWINRKGKNGEHGYLEWDKDDEAEINTPLYTHPIEPTDEEIHQAIRRGFSRDGFLSDGIFLEIKELLRKAQEK